MPIHRISVLPLDTVWLYTWLGLAELKLAVRDPMCRKRLWWLSFILKIENLVLTGAGLRRLNGKYLVKDDILRALVLTATFVVMLVFVATHIDTIAAFDVFKDGVELSDGLSLQFFSYVTLILRAIFQGFTWLISEALCWSVALTTWTLMFSSTTFALSSSFLLFLLTSWIILGRIFIIRLTYLWLTCCIILWSHIIK